MVTHTACCYTRYLKPPVANKYLLISLAKIAPSPALLRPQQPPSERGTYCIAMSSPAPSTPLKKDSDPDSDAGSVVSQSLTVEWEHEPFGTFQSRVLGLALGKIWPDAHSDEVVVDRMRGGGYNRIIGLARQYRDGSETQYILRIPRLDEARVSDDIAVLRFVQQNTKIPVPEVVLFDDTEDNAIGRQYSLQNRIGGTVPASAFLKLSHQQRCRFASEFGAIYRQMLSVRSRVAGKLVLMAKENGGSSGRSLETSVICVEPFGPEESKIIKPYGEPAPSEPIHEILTRVFSAQKADLQKEGDHHIHHINLLDRFLDMVSELHAGGWFSDQHYSLVHLDLAPRNILVNRRKDISIRLPIIYAVLDWDSAVLAPPFLACAPPAWIWNFRAWQSEDDSDSDSDERTADNVALTAEERQLKILFEIAAGREYKRLAYKSAYRLARRLVRIVVEGMRYAEDVYEAQAMVEEWEGLDDKEKKNH
ncbi:hypothetical protein B0T17DRAFT_544888 [Bombardia bombarda]|uniref:non-specific serine/threonine protein kinase n=1 Tax=Bombardia bombarda TaxID=252184 RepID=A0AA39U2S4_9PEZI|nr:hypothetical protein B0T17DRAFT_544888 [Bombardia bombarda]